MTRFFFLPICIICAVFAWAACSDDEGNFGGTPVFSIDEQHLQQDFEQGASYVSIPVNTNMELSQWSVASSDETWCLVSQEKPTSTSSSILISVRESEEPDVRTATVSVTSGVANYTIQVRQLGYGPAILLKDENPTISADGGGLDITVTSNVEYTIDLPAECNWMREVPTRALTDKVYNYTVDANPTYEERAVTLTYTYTEDPAVTAVCTVTQEAKTSGVDDVEVEGDVLILPTGAQASEYEPGNEIEYSYDGRIDENHYHSLWDAESVKFPVTLEYFFDQKPDIDYIVYNTRSGYGNFGEVDIYVATEDNPDYKLQGSYDFKMQNAASRVTFSPSYSKVTKIKFSVKSGLGGFVSCSEMQFFQKNPDNKLERQLLEVFTDITCTEVKDDATDAQIQALPGYFASLATKLRRGTYDPWEKEFRVQAYKPYSDVEVWAEKLMTSRYSNLDNPTGIYVEPGDSVIVLVGDTHGQSISIQCIGEEKVKDGTTSYVQTAASGETRFLEEGVNKVGFSQRGMLFVMYTADLLNPTAQPITIHIPPGSGIVSGFFDLETHKTNDKYAELIGKANYKYFCVRGERIMFYFHRQQMEQAVPYDILSAINLWDDIIGWQQELMGIEDVRPSQVNNHLFAISPEGSYMWASDYRIGFVYTYLDNILLYDNVIAAKDNAWGPAHEIGHVHQKAINWPSSTESSNNLFSNYILYKLDEYCSRGEELSALATARCINHQAWYNMGSATHQNEDTELHMRMNWQLWNYYHRCGHKPDFWPTLFKLLREDRIVESDPGAGQLKFAMKACQAANENLTDFFEMWGFFEPVPVNTTIEQYGTWNYVVDESMIESAKQYMKQFPKAKHAFYYLEDRKNGDKGIEDYQVGDVGYYTQFEGEGTKITKEVSYTRSGNRISITDGDEAVAFEIRQSPSSELLYFSNFLTFDVPSSVALDGAKVYAVQADGTRIECKKR